MEKYNPQKIEPKWQKHWKDKGVFKADETLKKEKFYVLDMFPYPSGSGLHVGHPKGYIATDVIARMKMMQGFNVLHPMGWDAFGLPAENYAIANKVHPKAGTDKNIEVFKKQLELLGFTYDWDREVNTTDPDYYKWTQWAFIQMFKKGIAYESHEPINWCPSCKTGLANEDVEDCKCERCGTVVEQKPLRQWVLKITDYADRLLEGLDRLPEWESSIKEMQRHWIGKSEGASVSFVVIPSEAEGSLSEAKTIEVFTTRPDTLFGATYMVLAPEHPLVVDNELDIKNYEEVKKYIEKTKNKTDMERGELNKDKTGVKLEGVEVINPVNNEKIPVFIADYVMMGYGTGAIMAVPAHDERDFEFAEKYGLEIKEVVAKKFGKRLPEAIHRDGVCGIIENEGKILVLMHKRTGIYRLPAGGFEEGENDEETILREIKEETGYKNVLFVDYLGTVEANYDATVIEKTVMRHRFLKGYSLKLENEDKLPEGEYESDRFDMMWLNQDEALEKFANNSESLGEDEFVKRYFDLESKCFISEGTSINSDFLDSLETKEAKIKIIEWLEEKGSGKKTTNYKLRDWVFSRQRYWGEPIPLVHCEGCENKKYNYICLHGFTGSNERNFWPYLVNALEEKGNKVFCPKLPNTDEPNVENQLQYIIDNVDFDIDENTVLVGHSLGGVVIYKLLEKLNKKVGKVLLIDPVVTSKFPDNSCPAVEKSCDWKFDWEKIKKLSSEFVILGDVNFEIIFEKDLRSLAKELNAELVLSIPEEGHFCGEKEPKILDLLSNSGWIPVPEDQLPLELPDVKKYEPSGTGESPLANIDEWVNTTCPKCGGPARRETNTMPQWAGSCWYYLRYEDPYNDKALVDKKKEKYWSPIDLYVGGAEHATRHLIYARFWHKFLYDIGVVNYDEPFTKLQHVGLILAEDGRKMSKRWNNVVNPDDIVAEFGADAMRVYEMFMGPFDQPVAWNTKGVVGARRFLDKVWNLQSKLTDENNKELETILHQTIKKVSEDISKMHFNTAIAQMMILVNEMTKQISLGKEQYGQLVQILSPFAPHITEELWSQLGNKDLVYVSWPEYDESKIIENIATIVVQINGKLRGEMTVSADISEDDAKKQALEIENVVKWLEGKKPKKVIYVKGKLVSVVV